MERYNLSTEFYMKQREQLNFFFCQDSLIKSAVIWGEEGLGKSTLISDIAHKTAQDILIIQFEEKAQPPYEDLKKGLSLSANTTRDGIISKLSSSFEKRKCLVFENIEDCDTDSLELIRKVINFRFEHQFPAVSIFEYNQLEKPNSNFSEISMWIYLEKLNDDEILNCIEKIVKGANYDDTHYIQKKLCTIARGNIKKLILATNILKHMDVLIESKRNDLLIFQDYKCPDSLLLLYSELFDKLNVHIQESLKSVVPFKKRIYTSLLKQAFNECQLLDEYLDEICPYQSFIIQKNAGLENSAFIDRYAFTSNTAIEAITAATPKEDYDRITARLYQYLERIHREVEALEETTDVERIRVLLLLTKIRNTGFSINHLPYFTRLMKLYMKGNAYYAVCEQANRFIKSQILNPSQINAEAPDFFCLYLKALLNIGEYDQVISYQKQLDSPSIQLLVSYAYYGKGEPEMALQICSSSSILPPCGEVYSLQSSIYDWLGDSRQSMRAFKKALKYTSGNDKLTYKLYKKYNLYVDFELPECKMRMAKAISYYKTTELRPYAEVLHNYGTGQIISFDEAGIQNLDLSKQKLESICERESYYPLNSIAINHCLYRRFKEAIQIWESINISGILVPFCKLAILNNLFCAYIKANNLEMANTQRTKITDELKKICRIDKPKSIPQQAPSIQHEVRQYFVNCALLEIALNNYDTAYKYLQCAIDCSCYQSTILYLIEETLKKLAQGQKGKKLSSLAEGFQKFKLGKPKRLEEFFATNQMYFCILMFWGDI